MIIFYDKFDGKIIGTIDGRVHNEDHLKMWAGDPETTGRIVINWEIVGYMDSEGNMIEDIEEFKKSGELFDSVWEVAIRDPEQKAIVERIELGQDRITDYKVDPEKGLLKLQ